MALMWNRTVDWDADDWRRAAACRNTEPDLFFPVGTTGPAVDQIDAAKRVCRSCEALEPCLDFALATNQESGVWGGTSEEERRKLRKAWLAISPMSYFDQYARWPKKSLIIYAKYDLTFLPEFSRQVVEEFERHGLDHKVFVLPCGHYTTGETPYKYIDGWQLLSFLRTAF